MSKLNRLIATVVVAAGAVVAQAGTSHAAACGVTFSVDTLMGADYEMNSPSGVPCITLTNGADLDMNGHKITCNGGYIGACNVGISATAVGSIVNNRGEENIAITSNSNSAWGTGVLNAQYVDDLRINRAFTGIQSNYATRISGNVLTNVSTCIDAVLVNNTSSIKHNLCDVTLDPGYGDDTGIIATGTTSGSGSFVQNNMVTDAGFGIYGYDNLRIENNIVCDQDSYFGFGRGVFAADTVQTFTKNLCCKAPEDTTDDRCVLPTALSGNFQLW